jgi:hypothetical protein
MTARRRPQQGPSCPLMWRVELQAAPPARDDEHSIDVLRQRAAEAELERLDLERCVDLGEVELDEDAYPWP